MSRRLHIEDLGYSRPRRLIDGYNRALISVLLSFSRQTDRPVHTHQFNPSISFLLIFFPYTHTAQFDIRSHVCPSGFPPLTICEYSSNCLLSDFLFLGLSTCSIFTLYRPTRASTSYANSINKPLCAMLVVP